jgi:hypothetical protein
MRQSPIQLPTTELGTLPPDDEEPARATFLMVFPSQLSLPVPARNEPLGRVWLAEMGIDDPKVSRRHLQFSGLETTLSVEDLGSKGGTWINGELLSPGKRVALTDRDVLRLGRTLLIYRSSFRGSLTPEPPIGDLVGPWGLFDVRRTLQNLDFNAQTNLLIEGETGAGKELLIRWIASRISPAAPPVSIPASAITSARLEATLLAVGSGADTRLVVLDDLGEMPLESQALLLRFLESRELLQAGAARPTKLNLMVIATSGRSTQDQVTRGVLRRDLVARFQHTIVLPSLDERREDTWAVFAAVWQALRPKEELAALAVDVEAVAAMLQYDWPENVREMERMVRAIPVNAGVRAPFIRGELERGVRSSRRSPSAELVQKTLVECGGDHDRAARQLGMSRRRLAELQARTR